jgi:hypothetical protein
MNYRKTISASELSTFDCSNIFIRDLTVKGDYEPKDLWAALRRCNHISKVTTDKGTMYGNYIEFVLGPEPDFYSTETKERNKYV